MNNSIPDNPVYSKQVLELLAVAHEYCKTLEDHDPNDRQKLLEVLQKLAPLMYVRGSLLPDIEVNNPEANERYITEEHWEELFNKLRETLGDSDIFWTFDPLNFAAEDARKMSLAEALTDTYQDMKDFVILYQKNSRDAKENAVSSIKELFPLHWGQRLIMIISAIHNSLYQHYQTDNDYLY
ncbi:MAG: DUF5063 domain-containing protein [Sphingobacteriia bacterium]|nr:DUF5063 domain-containing protein [Sphingobacteriia bacterium]